MPYDDPDATDPMTLHAIEVETDDPEAVREMAVCFVEEFVRLGVSAERIFEMFTDGTFAGPSMAYRKLGGEAISGMIAEQFAIRGPRRKGIPVDSSPGGFLSLPVME